MSRHITVCLVYFVLFCFFSSRRRHTRCALVTGVQTCALPIWTSVVPSMAIPPFARRGSDGVAYEAARCPQAGQPGSFGRRSVLKRKSSVSASSSEPAGSVDRKSTRLTPVTNAHLVCRLLLEKKKI